MPRRVLVAAVGASHDAVLREARRRRDEGQEVVFGGSSLDAQQVAHIARAEDVAVVVLVGDAGAAAVAAALVEAGVDGVAVEVAPPGT